MNHELKQKPDLSFWGLFNLSFGFFGVQIAYALQSGNISRIFSTIGADPKSLSFFWILPPLMGMIVQPIVGVLSDKTWCRFGRRIPYLIAGAIIAILVMCLLPNAGSLGAGNTALIIGAVILMFLDTSLNMAMQPFKMMVGDVVNEKQKGTAYAIQSFLCNLGQVVGFALPFLMSYIGFSDDASHDVPMSLKMAFYIGAAILIICVIYTCVNVKEMPPEEYAQYHGGNEEKEEESVGIVELLKDAPGNYWRVFVVQFFCWAAFQFMWIYSNGTIADTVWGTVDPKSADYQTAGNWLGIVLAGQAVASVAWAAVLPFIEHKVGLKAAYGLSIAIGAVGFAIIPFVHSQALLFLPYALIGCTWAAMLALPFTIVTNALEGRPHMGTYLGLFNCAICFPQIVAGLLGGYILGLLGEVQSNMMYVAAISLVLGIFSVSVIKTKE
ncbi:MAG: SLC45 family MFS transporter [Prevotella sp.]|nr:SLC45 family MFS transporter [Prevotella sp.]